jgi:hypothetical protein
VSVTGATGTAVPSAREEGFTGTLRRLAGAQKPPAKGSPAYSRFVNRKIGRVLAAAAYQLGLTPNQVTFISALFSAAAIALVALVDPGVGTGVLVALGLLVGYAFDSADGQLARLRGGGSPAGEWLDHVVDSVKTSALHLAVLIGWYRFADLDGLPVVSGDAALLVPLGFTLVAAVFFFVQILTDQLRRAHPAQAPAPAGSGAADVVRSLIVAPTDYGLLCLVFVTLGWADVFAVLYGLLFLGTTLFVLAALPKWYREVSRFRPVPKPGAAA